jgi:D-xylose transport system substrate-binding protein
MKKIIIILSLLLVVSVTVFVLDYRLNNREYLITKKNPPIIGLAVGGMKEERWAKDQDEFVRQAEELGAIVNVKSANQDNDTQASQIENFVSQGIKTIVVIPVDSDKIAPAIKKAKDAGAKVIAYDHLANNVDLDLYVSFDNKEVGRLEAAGLTFLKPKGHYAYIGGPAYDNNSSLLRQGSAREMAPRIKNGDITLVLNAAAASWEPEEAYNIIKRYLETGGQLDAVIAANDGLASGVRNALKTVDPENRILISGQDAELSACQRIVTGAQTVTVYKKIDQLADQAAEAAVKLANNQTVATTETINNGQANIPAILIEPIMVNKDNMMSTVIKDGFHAYSDVYQSQN